MRYMSVCSGIEAASVAWHPLGWEPAAFSEIEAFPRVVLAHNYPDVPLHGDFTSIERNQYGTVDLLVGGTPCQSFSVAGLRGGLSDARGNLCLEFVRLAYRLGVRWVVWENVPGVLSSSGGRDFACFLGGLSGVDLCPPGKVDGKAGWRNSGLVVGMEGHFSVAWRVLDAQYFGVAQRRRRVFVVGHLGDWRRAGAVLFESDSLSGHPAPSREEEERIAPSVTSGAPFSRTGNERVECEARVTQWWDGGDVADALTRTSNEQRMPDKQRLQAVVCATGGEASAWPANVTCTLNASFSAKQGLEDQHCLHGASLFVNRPHVRRLTPRECERLQGFPDDYTRIPWRGKPADQCPDGPRYKALGNSMAVPVMRWIGRRIDMVEAKGVAE